jgi:hypothetical protein
MAKKIKSTCVWLCGRVSCKGKVLERTVHFGSNGSAEVPICDRHMKVHKNIMALSARGMGTELANLAESDFEKLLSYSNKKILEISKKYAAVEKKMPKVFDKYSTYIGVEDVDSLSVKEIINLLK